MKPPPKPCQITRNVGKCFETDLNYINDFILPVNILMFTLYLKVSKGIHPELLQI